MVGLADEPVSDWLYFRRRRAADKSSFNLEDTISL